MRHEQRMVEEKRGDDGNLEQRGASGGGDVGTRINFMIVALSQTVVRGGKKKERRRYSQNTPPSSHVHDNGKTPAGENETLQVRGQPIEKTQKRLFCFTNTDSSSL